MEELDNIHDGDSVRVFHRFKVCKGLPSAEGFFCVNSLKNQDENSFGK